jgi:hypothetical protein
LRQPGRNEISNQLAREAGHLSKRRGIAAMKRYDPILQNHKHEFSTSDRFFAVMDDFEDGDYVLFEDIQQLAKDALPFVISAKPDAFCPCEGCSAKKSRHDDLITLLQAIVGEP